VHNAQIGSTILPVTKYDALRQRLEQGLAGPVELSFAEIDELVGGLPPSASVHSAWWANEEPPTRHVQALAWLDAGRRVDDVSLGNWVRFSARR